MNARLGSVASVFLDLLHRVLVGMDPAIVSTVSDDELLREALAVLDNSFDFGDLDMLTPFIVEDAGDSVDDLLKAVMDVARQDATPSSILEDPVSTTAIQGQETRSGTRHQSRDLPSGSSPHIEDAVEKLTPAGRGHGQGRVRLREQLIQLRSVVRQLETHLETLRSPISSRFDTCADPGQSETGLVIADESDCNQTHSLDSAGDGESRTTAWRDIAMQQSYGRRKAEQQNTQLRENLTTQIRLSKQLNTLLQSKQPRSGFSHGDL